MASFNIAVKLKRGLRSALNTLQTGGTLVAYTWYLITDENRPAIATSVNSYTALAKQSEAVPTGGTTGQVLSKNTNTSLDIGWTSLGTSSTQDAGTGANNMVQRDASGRIPTGSGLISTRTDKGTVSSGTVTFSALATDVQRLQVGGALTIAFSNWPASGSLDDMVLQLVNGGAYTMTWPTMSWVKSDGTISSTPTRTPQASGTDWIVIWSVDGGTTIYARFI